MHISVCVLYIASWTIINFIIFKFCIQENSVFLSYLLNITVAGFILLQMPECLCVCVCMCVRMTNRKQSSTHWFISQMSGKVEPKPGQSQEPEVSSRSPAWATGTQGLWSSCTNGSWIRSRTARETEPSPCRM